MKDASRGKFDVVVAWVLDRLGRSLIDLLDTLGELEAAGVALVLHQQAIDTTTPAGRMFFQVTGAFAEFERGMIEAASWLAWNAPGREAYSSGDQGLTSRPKPQYARAWHLEKALRKSPRQLVLATVRYHGSRPLWGERRNRPTKRPFVTVASDS